MARSRNWTVEELEYLQDSWGTVSIKGIANHLGRSIEAVKIKAGRIGLRDARFSLDGITLNQLSFAIHASYSILKNWVTRYGFPARRRVVAVSHAILVVRYDDFWKWAETHKDLMNFARLERKMLGPEPDWVEEKRQADIANYSKLDCRPWSAADDAKLRSMVSAFRYTYPEIAKALRRTEGAIKRRLHDLEIKARPVRLNNHIKWTDTEVQLMLEMRDKGHGLTTIARKVGKSEHAVRGKLERMGVHFRNELIEA